MVIILFGKPLAFWLGFLALAGFSLQIYLGIRMVRGKFELLKYHKINAAVLSLIVLIHLIFAISLYI